MTLPDVAFMRTIAPPPPRTDVLECLRQARALVATPDQWIKHSVHSYDGQVHRVCMVGAIVRTQLQGVDNELFKEASLVLKKAIWEIYPTFRGQSVEAFNDSILTRHAHVLRVFDAAIEAAEAEVMWNELKAEPEPDQEPEPEPKPTPEPVSA